MEEQGGETGKFLLGHKGYWGELGNPATPEPFCKLKAIIDRVCEKV